MHILAGGALTWPAFRPLSPQADGLRRAERTGIQAETSRLLCSSLLALKPSAHPQGLGLGHLPLILGLVAGCVSTYDFVPQVLKIWRERDCVAISSKMFVLRLVGFVLWLG